MKSIKTNAICSRMSEQVSLLLKALDTPPKQQIDSNEAMLEIAKQLKSLSQEHECPHISTLCERMEGLLLNLTCHDTLSDVEISLLHSCCIAIEGQLSDAAQGISSWPLSHAFGRQVSLQTRLRAQVMTEHAD